MSLWIKIFENIGSLGWGVFCLEKDGFVDNVGRKSRINIDIIKQKMRKDSFGEVAGYGLVILPKKIG